MLQGEEEALIDRVKNRTKQTHIIRLGNGAIISATEEEYAKLEMIADKRNVSVFLLLENDADKK